MNDLINFDLSGKIPEFIRETPKLIKIVGVGGGGNVANHMYRKGIEGVSFLVCDTDMYALTRTEVPHLRLGEPAGLRPGSNPAFAKAAAEASIKDIQYRLSDDETRMVLIVAGMGGETGTGAAPVIARTAKDMGILTVGIVTIPFQFEGRRRIIQALNGVDEISKNVDALFIFNNDRLTEIYPDLNISEVFDRLDESIYTIIRSIVELTTVPNIRDLGFQDLRITLEDSDIAFITTGYGEGDRRMCKAIDNALASPLQNCNDIFSAKKILLCISFSEQYKLLMEEKDDVDSFMSNFKDGYEVTCGIVKDNSLEDKVKITILASGFDINDALKNFPKEV